MSAIEKKNIWDNLGLTSIELLECSMQMPSVIAAAHAHFNFNIKLETKTDAVTKLLFVIVSVQVRTEDEGYLCGSVSVSCIYKLANFEKFVRFESGGKPYVSKELADVLNTASISTTRGVMYSSFKGTFLHDATLPLVDVDTFVSSIA